EGVDRLIAQWVAGIMVVAPLVSAAEAVTALPAHLPVVLVQGGPEAGAPEVIVDHESGARQAVEHLLKLGHRTVWHISGPEGWIESRLRQAGWRRGRAGGGGKEPGGGRGAGGPRRAILAGGAVA